MSRFAHDLADEDLTLEEFDVLVHLAWARDGVLPLRALVASMVSGYQLSRSGLTRLLDRMERDGLIERTLSNEDRRQFDVAITGRGREVFDRLWPGHLQGIQRYFSGSLTDRDVTVLKRVLAKLIKTNEPLLDQAAPRQRDRVRTVAAAATLSKP
jgi:MarR family transcriptional regulator, 2-MHQ and catechol-resistance regulon repressor